MIELPEALNLASQLRAAVAGKTVSRVLPPTKAHKFCWYCGKPEDYECKIANRSIVTAEGFGIFSDMVFDNKYRLCINDGVNVRLIAGADIPKNYQLAICFTDGCALVFTVAMYGGICLFENSFENEYYIKSRNALSPFSENFEEYYIDTFTKSKPTLSVKAFLATEQRFPGIGNGVLQDIMFNARLHPKRKISTLGKTDRDALLESILSTLRKMINGGGRDTEKNLYGNFGKYKTLMSKNSLTAGCPVCTSAITKENYLGGSVYYCPHCQRVDV